MHVQLGRIMNNKIQKGHKPTATSEVLGEKQGTTDDPCIQHHKGGWWTT